MSHDISSVALDTLVLSLLETNSKGRGMNSTSLPLSLLFKRHSKIPVYRKVFRIRFKFQ